MDYFNNCLSDLEELDDELINMTSTILTKKAKIIFQMERVALKRMNEIVDSAFINDQQLRENSYAFTAEHDDDSNRWFVYFNTDRVSYSEEEPIFEWKCAIQENLSKLYDYQRNAFAIQIYLIANYIEPDPICSKFYDTTKITNPRFTNLHPGWWYSQNLLHSFVPLKKVLRSKIKEEYENREQTLVNWVARKAIERIYQPGSDVLDKVAERFQKNKNL